MERGRITVTHHLFGFGATRSLGLHEIESIRVLPDWASGSRSTSRIQIVRRLRRPNESDWLRHVGAGKRIPTLVEAEALAAAMREGVGFE